MAYRLRCKNCGKHLLSYEAYDKKYKSPLCICRKCGCEYIDPRCDELAVVGIPKPTLSITKVVVYLIVGVLMALRGKYLFGMRMLNTPDSMQWVMPTLILLVGIALVIYSIVEFIMLISGAKQRMYERLLNESIARMSNAEYVEKLKLLGYIR